MGKLVFVFVQVKFPEAYLGPCDPNADRRSFRCRPDTGTPFLFARFGGRAARDFPPPPPHGSAQSSELTQSSPEAATSTWP